uniref:C2H2-type domain-containing protein n=1 Tax=Eptatretus burgeri TaxID=7764 RepID=A0A8C4PZQ8_EPTBU
MAEMKAKVPRCNTALFDSCSSATPSRSTECHADGVHPSTSDDAKLSPVLVDESISPGGENALPNKDDEEEEESFEETLVNINCKTPKQNVVQKEIEELERKIEKINEMKIAGTLTSKEIDEMIPLNKRLKMLRHKQARLKAEAERQRIRRRELKKKLSKLADENPSFQNFARGKRGRPSLQKDQPELLDAIKEIAMADGVTDDSQETECIRPCRTLNELTEELHRRGFQISRAATYLRLMPKRSDTEHGKRHVTTVPVKLKRTPKSQRKPPADTYFTSTTMSYINDLCSWFGPKTCSFMCIDDKARVPIGLTAASKQAPITMHMEYQLRQPDFDPVIAEHHKLIPSVFASCVIAENKLQSAVSCSGPTYIAIRSGKHDNSTACTHARDFEHLLERETFKAVMCNAIGELKPILVCSIDDGFNEKPRFPKALYAACNQFIRHNLDVYLAVTQLPGVQMYNHVERRMASLSRDLSGIILPHDSYGNHLDNSGKTVDTSLEVRNFQKAGETLAGVWSGTLLDGYDVFAEYVEPGDTSSLQVGDVSPKWTANHVRQSQYLLQIVRCEDRRCCTDWRTNWNKIIPTRFLPAPYPLQQSGNGVIVPEPEVADNCNLFASLSQRLAFTVLEPSAALEHQEIPFDLYCPSVRSEVKSSMCRTCHIYCASQEAVKWHKAVHDDSSTQASGTIEDGFGTVTTSWSQQSHAKIPGLLPMDE